MSKPVKSIIRFFKSPLARISFGLVMLTVSLLLISDFLGLMPDSRGTEVSYRQHIAETAAVQVSMEIGERDSSKLQQILASTVERNERVLSVAVRRIDGTVLYSEGAHSDLWTLEPAADSTVDQVRVTLFTPKGEWGAFELAFIDMPVSASMFRGGSAVLKIVLYVALAGFIGFYFFLKKVMRELDPDQVLPDRVRSALDSLTDGLLIVNHEGVIMFCNQALAKRIGINARKLTGKHSNSLDWVSVTEDEALPWSSVLDGTVATNEQALNLRVGHHQSYQFIVNASPVKGEGTDVRGALITFNDITELEKKHAELEATLSDLKKSQIEIEEQNRKLFTLATRDPLTNLFNRRAFFDAFDVLFEKAQQNHSRLACIMLDIDHFKSVNDTHGHSVGDEVIKYLADVLTEFQGDVDVVGRFGGEEFCMLIPDATVDAAVQRANKIRTHIETGTNSTVSVDLKITGSFGVALLPSEAKTPGEMIEFADLALYEAKTAGRNRVVSWQGKAGGKLETTESTSAASQTPVTKSESPQSGIAQANKDLAEGFAEDAQVSVRESTRRRDDDLASPGALVLVEPGTALTQRQLLATNIDTAIKRAKRDGHVMAVVVFDGNSLQYIANNVDYNIGNKLCSILVDRIKNLLRLSDVVSQGEMESFAGSVMQTEHNEVAVLLSDIDSKESIPALLLRLLAVFDQRIVIGGLEYVVDTHAGVSILGEDGNTAEMLLQNACMACSNAKMTKQRNSYSFYSAEMDEAAKRFIRLQADLYQAVEKNELEVHFQPKMDLITGNILGFEALLRWHHPQLAMIPPLEFIPIAESTGLIHKINNWVMTEVLDQINRWKQSGHAMLSVAVNVSALELKEPEFASKVLAIVAAAELPAKVIEIEITESIGFEEVDVACANLDKLHQAGMAISIDDFGTGYASLGYLQHFPITRLKIDRMFVNGCTVDEKKARVVRSIITMGNSLGMRVLAEGVETSEQLLFLRNHHCDEIQGYLVSKPVNAAETTRYLEKPSLLSQTILASTMGRDAKVSGATSLPLSGMDAIISRFPDAANVEQEQAMQTRETG